MNFFLSLIFRFGGILLWGLMIHLFYLFTEYEAHGRGFSTAGYIILLYDLVGKWGVMIILSAVSFFWSRQSYRHYKRMKNGELIDGLNPDGSTNMWAKKKK